MVVIARLDDPLAVLLTDDLSDVVRPHDHSADPNRPRPAPMGPLRARL